MTILLDILAACGAAAVVYVLYKAFKKERIF